MVTGSATAGASISDRTAPRMSVLPDGDFVVADLEYTAWEGSLANGWSAPGEFREIVQIGAVRVSHADGLHEADALSVLVRPTLNPRLSDYFTDLTGITNDDVAREGVSLAAALKTFADFARGLPILTHGGDDRVVIVECAGKSLNNPLADCDWQDIRPVIGKVTGQTMMSADLPAHFGLPDLGGAHNALADSRALVQVLAHLSAKALL